MNQAFAYASDGLMELVDPARVNKDGIHVGLARRRLLAGIRVETLGVFGAVLAAASQYTDQPMPEWQVQQFQGHPVGPFVLQAVADMKQAKSTLHHAPGAGGGLAQQMPAFIGAPAPAKVDTPTSSGEARHQVWQMSIVAESLLVSTRQSLLFDAGFCAQVAAARKLVQQALGLEPTMADRLLARRPASPPVQQDPSPPRLSV